MKTDIQPCNSFVVDLNAFVDKQLNEGEALRLVDHTRQCEGCADYLVALRRLSEFHRQTAAAFEGQGEVSGAPYADSPEAVGSSDEDGATIPNVDARGLFAAVTGVLASDKRTSLARLFYEIGKAYVMLANRSQSVEREIQVRCSRPRDVRKSEAEARRVVFKHDALASAGGHEDKGGVFRRSRKLFAASGKGRSAAFAKGRAFLEEALALDKTLDEARLYLGLHFMMQGHGGRAAAQFEQVSENGRTDLLRLMGLQGLGKLHEDRGEYRAAVEFYADVISRASAEDANRLLQSFVNLPVSCAKAGMVEESVEHFSALVNRFPRKLNQIQNIISKKQTFQAVLDANSKFHNDLRQQVPALFTV
ncbi:MAG: tetratricopeptide (TPR) repeat protein [Pseudohongiellaceae bacterium]|jgi:tetratricopeptide (TPR) repeat protein